MELRTYVDAGAFLENTQGELESNEASNSLMLGICGRLARFPERIKVPPLLKTVEDAKGLVVAALMTPPHKLIVYGHQGDLASGTRILVEALVKEGVRVPGVLGPGRVASLVAESWVELTAGGYCHGQRQGVYELRKVITPVPERGRLRLAEGADQELAARWRYAFHQEIFGVADEEEAVRETGFRIEKGDLYLWQDGRPVSMAMRTRPTRRGISVSLVYTPPELRRRGYATACVGELSRLLLAEGWEFCALFTDLANPTSNQLYQRIGYKPVCDYDEYVFGEA